MRILLITFDSPARVGGLEARAVNYSRHLTEMGHTVSLMVVSNVLGKELRIPGVDIITVPSNTRRIASTFLRIAKYSRAFRAESQFLITGGLTLLGVLLLLSTSLRVRNTILIYGKDVLSIRSSFKGRLLLTLALIFSRRIAVNSKATATLLPSWTASKTRLLYPGVDVILADRPKGTESTSTSSRRVLFVGRLVERKGADDLIKAVHLLSKEMPEVKLEIVGDGSEMLNLQRLVRELKLEPHVSFLGELSGAPLHQRYDECDVFCMPSRSLKRDVEGFGIVFLEAGLFGKPSVGTWSGGIPEAVIHNETGLLVEDGDVSALKGALKAVLTDRELALKLGSNARLRVTQEFSWRKGTERLIEIL